MARLSMWAFTRLKLDKDHTKILKGKGHASEAEVNISGEKRQSEDLRQERRTWRDRRGAIYTSHIKSSRVLYLTVRMSLQLKVRTNRGSTSNGTNHLMRAETNRAPLDLTEGESELASGFNVEYSAGPFAMFFLAEYANIIIINIFTTILFLGAFHNPHTPELYTVNFIVETLLLTVSFL
ncbi:hypothetical protein EI555_011866 [Monodon monoceros]|uniref:NADH-ubiquinone oxidoreductase chain 1 n=1 Tax=Monodon monoceros TaxID=40151 RepID=A0A4V5PAY0_MONMO|nr:hypothetical protein EI555_011866 [Monodon monoceros]